MVSYPTLILIMLAATLVVAAIVWREWNRWRRPRLFACGYLQLTLGPPLWGPFFGPDLLLGFGVGPLR
jgi:hypothetical protein